MASGSQCHVCGSAERAQIELGIAWRVPYRVLAKRFPGISIHSISRHRKAHMPAQLLAALVHSRQPTEIDLDQLRKSESEGLLQHLLAARGRIYGAMDQAIEFGDLNVFARLNGELNKNLALTGRLLGEFSTAAAINVNALIVTPAYLQLRHELTRILRAHPAVAVEVAQVFRGLEVPEAPVIDVRALNGGADARSGFGA